jgi:hypothetical protein
MLFAEVAVCLRSRLGLGRNPDFWRSLALVKRTQAFVDLTLARELGRTGQSSIEMDRIAEDVRPIGPLRRHGHAGARRMTLAR